MRRRQFDGEPGKDRRHLEAPCSQRPCAVKTPQGKRLMVALKRCCFNALERKNLYSKQSVPAHSPSRSSTIVSTGPPREAPSRIPVDVRRFPWVKRLAA